MPQGKKPEHGLRPVPARAAVAQVAQQIRDAILSGQFTSGSRLVEQDIAVQLGISRGPVREALQLLGYEGLVTLRPNRGAVVSAATVDDVLEVYALRADVGALAIRFLVDAGLVTDAVTDQLRRLAARALRSANQKTLVRTDLAFQTALVETSGLPRATARFRELTAEITMFIATLAIQYTNTDRIVDEHDRLLAAVVDRDAALATRLWREHSRAAVREFLELVPGGVDADTQRRWAGHFA